MKLKEMMKESYYYNKTYDMINDSYIVRAMREGKIEDSLIMDMKKKRSKLLWWTRRNAKEVYRI